MRIYVFFFFFLFVFFFFQAEDGIRDRLVTGVQTCALPICPLFCVMIQLVILDQTRRNGGDELYPFED